MSNSQKNRFTFKAFLAIIAMTIALAILSPSCGNFTNCHREYRRYDDCVLLALASILRCGATANQDDCQNGAILLLFGCDQLISDFCRDDNNNNNQNQNN